MARILVLNPTLGTGGGSRWSLQAAESLALQGHEVDWVAGAARQPPPAWPELATATFRRRAVDLRWPETFAGRGRALCSTVRALRLLRWSNVGRPAPDALLLDSVPFVLARARVALPRSRLVFYCHFPETLYAPAAPWFMIAHRRYWIHRERLGLRAADRVLVNGRYTHARLLATFPELAERVAVCHPAVRWQPARAPTTPRHVLCVARWDPEKISHSPSRPTRFTARFCRLSESVRCPWSSPAASMPPSAAPTRRSPRWKRSGRDSDSPPTPAAFCATRPTSSSTRFIATHSDWSIPPRASISAWSRPRRCSAACPCSASPAAASRTP